MMVEKEVREFGERSFEVDNDRPCLDILTEVAEVDGDMSGGASIEVIDRRRCRKLSGGSNVSE